MEKPNHSTSFHSRAIPRALPLAIALLASLALPGPAGAQPFGAPGESTAIRDTARKILDAPEFRHFRRIEPGSGSPGDGTGAGDGESGDGSGAGRGDFGEAASGGEAGRGRGNPQGPRGGRDDAERSEPGSSPDDASRSGGATMPSPGGGAIAQAIGGLMHLVAWLGLAAIAGLIVYLVVKAIQNYERPHKIEEERSEPGDGEGHLEPERPPGELPADVYLTKARELAAEGRFREAVAQLLLGGMSNIERAGLIQFRRGLTCRDYVRAARGNRAVYQGMRSMVMVYEPLGFGRREATHAHFDRALAGYESGLQQST